MTSNLVQIINKLGHPLVEIRTRALRNIEFKLQHGLIAERELLFGFTIIRKLLQWFNFDSAPNKLEVLLLLSRLLKTSDVVGRFKQIGGLEFLLSLKKTLPPNLAIVIDEMIQHVAKAAKISDHSTATSSEFSERSPSLCKIPPVYRLEEKQAAEDSRPAETPTKINFFPWLPLCRQDRQVLSTLEKLLSKNDGDCLTACSVFANVALADFPAEVFLSRPRIVKMLLDRLMPTKSSSSATILSILTCLDVFVDQLRGRISSFFDKSLISCKDSFLANQKMGEKFEDIPDLIEHDMLQVKDRPMSVLDFILAACGRCFPLFGLIASRTIVSALLVLSRKLIKLFEMILVSPALLWSSKCSTSGQHTAKITSLADIIGRAVEKFKKSSSESMAKFYRMMFLHLMALLNTFLDVLWPPQYSHQLPSSVVHAFLHAVNDEFIGAAVPSIRDRGLAVLEANLPYELGKFRQHEEILCSLRATQSFLEFFADDDTSISELVDLAEDSLLSHIFHSHSQFVSSIFDLAAALHSTEGHDPDLGKRLQNIVGVLLSSPCPRTREMAYGKCLLIVQNSLGSVSQSPNIQFLAHFGILRQICFTFLESEDIGIADVAKGLLTLLTQSDIVIAKSVLSHLLPILWRLMPIIQTTSEPGTELLENIFYHLSSEDNSHSLLSLIRYSCSVYSTIRARAHEMLALIIGEKVGTEFEQIFVRQFHEGNKPAEIVYGDSDLAQLYKIFLNQSADIELRTAAVNQIAVYLRDPLNHPSFITLRGLTSATSCLKSGRTELDEIYVWEVKSQATFLFEILSSDETNLRQEVGNDGKLLKSLLKLVLVLRDCHGFLALRGVEIIVKILQIVAFTDIHNLYAPTSPSQIFKISQHVSRRFKLYAKGEAMEYKSPFPSDFPTPGEIMTENMISSRFRIFWNLNISAGFEQLIDLIEKRQIPDQGTLTLRSEDAEWLRNSITDSAIESHLGGIDKATTHKEVLDSVGDLFLSTSTRYTLGIKKDWLRSFTRFITILPSSEADTFMVQQIFKLFVHILQSGMPLTLDEEDLEVFSIFLTSEIDDCLFLDVLLALHELLKRLSGAPTADFSHSGSFNTLFRLLVHRLEVSAHPDTPKIYETEKILEILALMTSTIALSDENSLYCISLFLNLITKFLRQKNDNCSYISNGIVRYSAYSLLHILTGLDSEQSRLPEILSQPGQTPFEWLLSLWNCRDQQIRSASYGIAVLLTTSTEGQRELASSCFSLGSIWNACLTVIADSFESSIVKQQAAKILQNMICDLDQSNLGTPTFRDDNCLTGLDALFVIMKKMKWIDIIDGFAENCSLPWKSGESIDYELFSRPELLYSDEFSFFVRWSNSDPRLFAWICRLFSSLLEKDPESFEKHFSLDFMARILSMLSWEHDFVEQAGSESLLLHVELMESVLNLLAWTLTCFPDFVESLIQSECFIATVLKLFKAKDVLDPRLLRGFLGSAFQFFQIFVETEGIRAWCVLDVILTPKLGMVFDCLAITLGNPGYLPEALRFVYSLIRHVYSLVSMGYQENYFDGAAESPSWRFVVVSILIPYFEEMYAKPRKLVNHDEISQLAYGSLKLLLGFSSVSCQIACEEDLVARLTENAQLIINHLTLENIQSKSKKIALLRTNLAAILQILQNLCYNSLNVQETLMDLNFPFIAISAWDHALLHEPLLRSLLGVLLNYSHNSPLCADTLSVFGGSCNDVSCVVLCAQLLKKFRAEDLGKEHVVTCLRLLANVSVNPNGRISIRKAGVMDGFFGNFQRFVKNRISFEKLWLTLLRNLSFFKDGLAMIVRDNSEIMIKDVVEFLMNCALNHGSYDIALVIRNICFVGSAKNVLLSLDGFFALIQKWLMWDDVILQTLACSVILHLSYKTHKVKLLFKSKGVESTLKECIDTCSSDYLGDRLCRAISSLQ